MVPPQLKLENQLCFPVYAASRLIVREYQPLLDKMGITYPQYLVLMVLWERDGVPVTEITRLLLLNTNTVTPLLQRMETMGLLVRQRSKKDERKVIIKLTDKGRLLQKQAAPIPEQLACGLLNNDFTMQDLVELRNKLNTVIRILSDKETVE